jgi:hypothetical protein
LLYEHCPWFWSHFSTSFPVAFFSEGIPAGNLINSRELFNLKGTSNEIGI